MPQDPDQIIGFAAHKRADLDGADRAQRTREMLSRVLNLRTTIAFVGAGCSAPLGYPTWREFGRDIVKLTINDLGSVQRDSRSTLGNYRKVLNRAASTLGARSTAVVSSERLLHILGMCERIWSERGRGERYYDRLEHYFRERAHRHLNPKLGNVAWNPYPAILDLPILRFVTTNYDCELDSALATRLRLPVQEFLKVRSFTQTDRDYDQIALFGMARAAKNTVFHCHGRWIEPESMIITEGDYQKWYLSDPSWSGGPLGQTMELVFGSNPVLFIGFSLQDDDLMLALRIFSAVEPHRKATRPLFALLPNDEVDGDYASMLFERYGVNVVSYPVSGRRTQQARGEDLRKAIESLRKRWIEDRRGWLSKPRLRSITVAARPPQPYFHHHVRLPSSIQGGNQISGGTLLSELVDTLSNETPMQRPRLIGITGAGGCGKSWLALRLVQELSERKNSHEFRGFFFWTSYYVDDPLSGMERALKYCQNDGEAGPPNTASAFDSRLDRLRQALQESYLIVIDGVERLLREDDPSGESRASTVAVRELLKLFASTDHLSTIVLTSRTWPEELAMITPIRMAGMTSAEAAQDPLLTSIPKDALPTLVSLLEGHRYGLALAATALRLNGRDSLPELRRRLSDTTPIVRLFRMIALALEAVQRQFKSCPDLPSYVLQAMALCMGPVKRTLVNECYDIGVRKLGLNGSQKLPTVDALIKAFIGSYLLFEVQPVVTGARKPHDSRYVLHPTLREYVFRRVHGSTTDAWPNFQLSGFTSGDATVDPGGGEGQQTAIELLKRLLDRGEKSVKDRKQARAAEFCQTAFGILRSRMSAIAAPRWCNYADYMSHIVRLGDLAKAASPRPLWLYAARADRETYEHPDAPLFGDDLAWLYNEIGLTHYAAGEVLDALAVWEQAYEINKLLDPDEADGHIFQSCCNLGAANIQFGRLRHAEDYFLKALKVNRRVKDRDHAPRILGYLALIEHLRGNLKEADERYKEAIEEIKEVRGNLRAVSIFMRHRADLKIKLQQYDRAELLIQTSRAKAEAGKYPDLIAFARLTYGHLQRSKKKFPEAVREYRAALHEARRIGIRGLEADALSELSRVALDLGDALIARQRAMKALQLANEGVLGLRQTHCLVVLGLATIQAGRRPLGLAYLRHAKSLAEQQEYWLRGREAEEYIQRFGDTPET